MSPPLIRRLKRRLSKELESTAESHLMHTPKRPRIDTDELPQTIKFRPKALHKFFLELVRARRYYEPYHDPNLQWEEDLLRQQILDALQLEVDVSVHEFKMNVLSYYKMYQQDHAWSSLNLPKEMMTIISEAFHNSRGSIGEYLGSYFRPSPNLALEYHRESASTVSLGHRPGSSGTIQHRPGSSGTIQQLHSFPSSSFSNPYGAFIQGLKEIRDELSQEEYTWTELEMAKYDARIALFSDYDRDERIRLIKSSHADKTLGGCRGGPESP